MHTGTETSGLDSKGGLNFEMVFKVGFYCTLKLVQITSVKGHGLHSQCVKEHIWTKLSLAIIVHIFILTYTFLHNIYKVSF